VFWRIFQIVVKQAGTIHEAVFAAPHQRGYKVGDMPAKDFFAKKFMRNHSEDQLEKHLRTVNAKLEKLQQALQHVQETAPLLVLESESISIILHDKRAKWANDAKKKV